MSKCKTIHHCFASTLVLHPSSERSIRPWWQQSLASPGFTRRSTLSTAVARQAAWLVIQRWIGKFLRLSRMSSSIHSDCDGAVGCRLGRKFAPNCMLDHLCKTQRKVPLWTQVAAFPPLWWADGAPAWWRTGGEQKTHESCSCLDPGSLVAMHSTSMDSLTNLQQSASHCARESARAALWVFHTWAMCHTVQHFWCNRGGGEKTSLSLCLTFFLDRVSLHSS